MRTPIYAMGETHPIGYVDDSALDSLLVHEDFLDGWWEDAERQLEERTREMVEELTEIERSLRD